MKTKIMLAVVVLGFIVGYCLACVVGERQVCQQNAGGAYPVPQANAGLVIVHRYPGEASSGVRVLIQATTNDAEKWLTENAPKFGALAEFPSHNGKYMFSVQPEVYDVDTVLDYLVSNAP